MAPPGAETVKRDMDLVRQILIAVQEHEHGYEAVGFLRDAMEVHD